MGVLEGYFTASLIDAAFVNYNLSAGFMKGGHLPDVLQRFLEKQLRWMQSQVAAYSTSSNTTLFNYWQQVDVLLAHLAGIYDGYVRGTSASVKLTRDQVYSLAYMADLEDLANAIPYINNSLPPLKTYKSRLPPRERMMHFSGFDKLDPQFKDIYTGHTTFNALWCMLRVFKHYSVTGPGVQSSMVSFSSRPGDMHSKDDFFLLSRGMTVIETSLTVFNQTLYKALSAETVPCWIRSQVANRLSTSAPDWAALFSMYNSGTHNNEWIVTDYTVFQAGSPPPPNTIWILDQMVDVIEAADATATLKEQLYLPSYNIPYFHHIFVISGYAAHNFSYDHDPRANIFRRDHVKAHSLQSMADLMNSNDWEHDPLAQDSPCNQISARCDIGSGGYAFAGIDSKNVDSASVKSHSMRIISGPPHDFQPVFSFEPRWDSVAHAGMPITWDFDWLTRVPDPK